MSATKVFDLKLILKEYGDMKMNKPKTTSDINETPSRDNAPKVKLTRCRANPKKEMDIAPNFGLTIKPGENKNFLSLSIELMNLEKIDIYDPEQVKERLSVYFALYSKYDLKPTVAGMGLAIGLNRRRLWEIKTGKYRNETGGLANLPMETTDIIRKAYDILEQLWESYSINGKINPVISIFFGTNNFGYQSRADHSDTAMVERTNVSVEDIQNRYGVDFVQEVDGNVREEVMSDEAE